MLDVNGTTQLNNSSNMTPPTVNHTHFAVPAETLRGTPGAGVSGEYGIAWAGGGSPGGFPAPPTGLTAIAGFAPWSGR